MSPPLGSHSATITGAGQVSASAIAAVVTPGEPPADTSAYSSPTQEPRFVTMSANWPVDTCSATAAPALSLTSRSTTSRPSESGTSLTASTTPGTGAVSDGDPADEPACP